MIMNNDGTLYIIVSDTVNVKGKAPMHAPSFVALKGWKVVNRGIVTPQMVQSVSFVNATVKGGVLQADCGRFSRLAPIKLNNGTQVSPLIILTEIRDASENVLGYRVSDTLGNVNMFKLSDILIRCAAITKSYGKSFVQNGIYRPKTDSVSAYIACYPGHPFAVEYRVAKKAVSGHTPVPAKPACAAPVKGRRYTAEQLAVFKDIYKRDGKIPAYLRSPKFSADLLRAIYDSGCTSKAGRENLTYKIDPKGLSLILPIAEKFSGGLGYFNSYYHELLTKPYSIPQISVLSQAIAWGLDIKPFANEKFSEGEMLKRFNELFNSRWDATIKGPELSVSNPMSILDSDMYKFAPKDYLKSLGVASDTIVADTVVRR